MVRFRWTHVAAAAVLLVGCQRLPQPQAAEAGGGTTGSEPSGSTFLPTADGLDDGSEDGAPTPDPTVCIENRAISYLEINSIQDLAGVEVVRGPLHLKNMTHDKLQWVQCLRRVTDIQDLSGSLFIEDSIALTDLDALQHLESVSGALQIWDNPALDNVHGLSSLTNAERVIINRNPVLTSVAGLEHVVTQVVDLADNPRLPNATFSAVSELDSLWVDDNARLAGLSFPQLTRAESVVLRELPLLTNIDGLDALEEVDYISLADLEAVTSVAGLASLREVTGNLRMSMLPAVDEVMLPSLTHTVSFGLDEMASLERVELPSSDQLEEIHLAALPQLEALPAVPASAGLHSIVLEDLPLISTLDRLEPGGLGMSHLMLSDMPMLSDLDTVTGTNGIEGTLSLVRLPLLDSLSFLADLTHVVGSASFESLPLLTSLEGLEQLQSASDLSLAKLDGLTSLEGLGGLADVRALVVVENAQLGSLLGLEGVATAWRLVVAGNPALTNIDALYPAPERARLQIGDRLQITGNATLSQCDAEAFLQLLLDGGWLGENEVVDNGPC